MLLNPYLYSSLKLHNAPVCLRTNSRVKGMPVMSISDTEGRVSARFDSTYMQVYDAFISNGIRVQEDSFVPGSFKFVAGGYLTPGSRMSDEEFSRLVDGELDNAEEDVVCCEVEEGEEC